MTPYGHEVTITVRCMDCGELSTGTVLQTPYGFKAGLVKCEHCGSYRTKESFNGETMTKTQRSAPRHAKDIGEQNK